VAAPGLKSVAIGVDHGEALRLTLEPNLQLQIPKQAVDKSKPEDKSRRDQQRVPGWNQQEDVLRSQGDLRQEKRDNWRRFQSGTGRRSNYGAILIDGPQQPKTLPPPINTPSTEGGTGWQTIDNFHGQAARFEERNRGNVDQLGGEGGVDVDPRSPQPRARGGASRNRRRFTVAAAY
jgi:hypothetical protein